MSAFLRHLVKVIIQELVMQGVRTIKSKNPTPPSKGQGEPVSAKAVFKHNVFKSPFTAIYCSNRNIYGFIRSIVYDD